jgi:hypothetical protein
MYDHALFSTGVSSLEDLNNSRFVADWFGGNCNTSDDSLAVARNASPVFGPLATRIGAGCEEPFGVGVGLLSWDPCSRFTRLTFDSKDRLIEAEDGRLEGDLSPSS